MTKTVDLEEIREDLTNKGLVVALQPYGDGHFMHTLVVGEQIMVRPFRPYDEVEGFFQSPAELIELRDLESDSRGGLQSKDPSVRRAFRIVQDYLEIEKDFKTVPTYDEYF